MYAAPDISTAEKLARNAKLQKPPTRCELGENRIGSVVSTYFFECNLCARQKPIQWYLKPQIKGFLNVRTRMIYLPGDPILSRARGLHRYLREQW